MLLFHYLGLTKYSQLIRLVFISILLTLVSCRCSTDFRPEVDNSADTTIQATAHVWQGQYEYMSIDVKINRTDSMFVKNIQITPTIRGEEFYPEFKRYEMYSYSLEKNQSGPYWKRYPADRFELLPKDNRQTNIGEHPVEYSAFYTSKRHIHFREFSATIIVTLINNTQQEIKYNRVFNFTGNRNCRLSVH